MFLRYFIRSEVSRSPLRARSGSAPSIYSAKNGIGYAVGVPYAFWWSKTGNIRTESSGFGNFFTCHNNNGFITECNCDYEFIKENELIVPNGKTPLCIWGVKN